MKELKLKSALSSLKNLASSAVGTTIDVFKLGRALGQNSFTQKLSLSEYKPKDNKNF